MSNLGNDPHVLHQACLKGAIAEAFKAWQLRSGMDATYASALIGAFSAGAVALAVYVGQRQQSRTAATLAIYAEFNTPDWMTKRQQAYDSISRCPDPDLFAMRDAADAALSKGEREVVWALLAFYARLSIMVDARVVTPRLILPCFGEVFIWWWEFSFKHLQSVTSASELAHIAQLRRWMSRRALMESRQYDLNDWGKGGAASRRQALERSALRMAQNG